MRDSGWLQVKRLDIFWQYAAALAVRTAQRNKQLKHHIAHDAGLEAFQLHYLNKQLPLPVTIPPSFPPSAQPHQNVRTCASTRRPSTTAQATTSPSLCRLPRAISLCCPDASHPDFARLRPAVDPDANLLDRLLCARLRLLQLARAKHRSRRHFHPRPRLRPRRRLSRRARRPPRRLVFHCARLLDPTW